MSKRNRNEQPAIMLSPEAAAVHSLCQIVEGCPPQYAQRYLMGILGSALASMPKEYWEQFKVTQPCGEAGCECHIHAANLMPPFEKLRQWALVNMPADGQQ